MSSIFGRIRPCPVSYTHLFFRGRRDLKERMLEQGILIRSCADFRNLGEGYFRIGIRTREENEELIRRWRAMEGKCTAAAKG